MERARASSRALSLDGVTFQEANVEDVELEGSIFFLYSPFSGAMLSHVLARLEDVPRPIKLGTVDLDLGHVAWLRARTTARVSLTIYESL